MNTDIQVDIKTYKLQAKLEKLAEKLDKATVNKGSVRLDGISGEEASELAVLLRHTARERLK